MLIFNQDKVREPLYAVVPYFNPWRSKSRVKHTQRAIKHFADSGCVVILVEAALGDREFVFEDSGLHGSPSEFSNFKHRVICLRAKDEIWLKENLINIGVQSLPDDWKYVTWPDADVHFARPNWVGETLQKLQHHAFVQPFTQACDLGPNYELLPSQAPSFVQLWKTGKLECTPDPYGNGPANPPWPGWPGLAWACTHEAWDAVGGLIDFAVWGGADYDMAFALIERSAETHTANEAHSNYQKLLTEWEDRCRWNIRKNIGVVDGMLLHHWHGQKTLRHYNWKRKVMCKAQFDPLRHLKRGSNGLWQMNDDGSENFIVFRDTMRQIAAERREDSSDV